MGNYFVTLEQKREYDLEGARFAIGGNLFGSKRLIPVKTGLTTIELEEFLPIVGIPFNAHAAIFRELAQTRYYSFTTSLSKRTAIELGWPSDE